MTGVQTVVRLYQQTTAVCQQSNIGTTAMNFYRHFSDYYWNPQEIQSAPKLKAKLQVTIDECLKSQPVHNKIVEACLKYGYKVGIAKDILRACVDSGHDGSTVSGQERIAEITGWCKTTVQKYYRFLVQRGMLYCYHRNRQTKDGARRTTNLTIVTILLDYAERCAEYAKKALNKGVSLIPRNETQIVSLTTPAPKPPAKRSLADYLFDSDLNIMEYQP